MYVSTVKLHAFDNIQLIDQRLAVFDGDDSFAANFLHGVRDQFADGIVSVSRNGGNLIDKNSLYYKYILL